ncbi:MAG: hypothetical protein ACOCV2_08765, partial [Persicimonas sp.]
VTQGVSGMRQVTVAASELAELSESLRDLVERFEIGESAEALDSWREQTHTAPGPSAAPESAAGAAQERVTPHDKLPR